MAPVIGRIRTRAGFVALARPDGRGSTGPLSVAYRACTSGEQGGEVAAVGYAIGRHHGKAVARNRLRRRLRAAMRVHAVESDRLPGGTYLVRARAGAAALPYAALERSLRVATERATKSGPSR